MGYRDEPDAEYIVKFAKRREERFQGQQTLDERQLGLVLKTSAFDVAGEKTDVAVKPLRMGFGGVAIDSNLALFSEPPFLRLNIASASKLPEKQGADLLGEPFINGAFAIAQLEAVWVPQTRDMMVLGRGFSTEYPHPGLWSGDEYSELVEEWNKRIEEKSEDKAEEAHEALLAYKRANFPIRWALCDSRNTWPLFSRERWLPEVVEIRKMTLADIEAEYGEDKVPTSYSGERDKTEVDVYEYANHRWTATVVSGKAERRAEGDDSRIARKWRHDLGRSPYILMELPRFPANDQGWVWKGMLKDYADAIEAQDEMMSDARHNIRQYTTRPIFAVINPELPARAASIQEATAARPFTVPMYPGTDSRNVLFTGESLVEGPVPELNPELAKLLQHTNQYLTQVLLNPAMWRMLSGQSGGGYVAELKMNQKRLSAIEQAQAKAATDFADLLLKSVIRISDEFPKAPDEIFILDPEKGEIAVTAKHARSWLNKVQPVMREALPQSENALMDLMVAAQQLPLGAEDVLAIGHIENPTAKVDNWIEWKILQALIGSLTQKTQAFAGELAEQAAAKSLQGMAEDIATLPPAALQALMSQGTAPMPAPTTMRDVANRRRMGQVEQVGEPRDILGP